MDKLASAIKEHKTFQAAGKLENEMLTTDLFPTDINNEVYQHAILPHTKIFVENSKIHWYLITYHSKDIHTNCTVDG